MITKIVSVKPNDPQTLRAIVNFLDGDVVVLERSYDFSVDLTIESIYPQMKEDLNNLEKGKVLVANLEASLDQAVDLSQVKSTSELQTEKDAQALEIAKVAEAVLTPPEAEPSNPLG